MTLADGWGDSHPDRLEDLSTAAKTLAADAEPLAVLIDSDITKGCQILLDIRPLKVKLSFLKSRVKLLESSFSGQWALIASFNFWI